jgi:hypothetical protein
MMQYIEAKIDESTAMFGEMAGEPPLKGRTTATQYQGQIGALAAFVELPLASVCIWLSWHAQQLEERRIVLLMRRYRGRLHRGGRRERA